VAVQAARAATQEGNKQGGTKKGQAGRSGSWGWCEPRPRDGSPGIMEAYKVGSALGQGRGS
jgi:hypothetical protein